MFDFFKTNPAISMLKEDHDRVKALFREFESTDDPKRKKQIVKLACQELGVHSAIEEELFYPAVRALIDDKEIMNEADEEHHEAKVLIAELETMDGSESHYAAKFTVLAENIEHHIEEEEGQMLPKASKLDINFEALSRKMKRRQQELLKNGLPTAAEEKMVAASRGRGDSPAQHSHLKSPVSRKKS